MAENLVLGSFATLQNSSIISTLNANNTLIETAFADCLSLSGIQPNQMQSDLDMNSQQIINLPAPATLNSAIRLIDLQNAVIGSFGTGIYGLLGGTNTWTAVNTFSNTTQSTTSTNGAVVIEGGLGIAKNLNVGGTFSVGTVVGTGVTTITINNLGGTFPTAGSDGIVLQNTTAATSGVRTQISPDIRFSGNAWNTTTSTSQEIDWIMSTVPISGSNTTIEGYLAFGCQINGAGYKFIGNWLASTTFAGLFIGDALTNTLPAQIVIAGNNSGTSGGGLITVQNGNSTNVFLLGNKSAIFGGSYDSTPVIFANAISGGNPLQFIYTTASTPNTTPSISVGAQGTVASSTTTGTLIVTGGVGISGNEWIAAGTLAAGGSVHTLTATQPASPVASQNAISWTITGAGSASQTNSAFQLLYSAGYTGSSPTQTINVNNANLGTGNTLVPATNGVIGNIGIRATVNGAATGLNAGLYGWAGNSTGTNVGVIALAQSTTASAVNIGLVASGVNSSGTPIGAFITLGQTSTPATSAALIVDNFTVSAPIALFRANGTTVVQFTTTGAFTSTSNLAVLSGTGNTAGGVSTSSLSMGSGSIGVYYGSGAPTISAAQGSIYLRSDGTQNNRLYINTNGSTTWTAFSTTS